MNLDPQKVTLAAIPVALAIIGWAATLESRVQVIASRQEERAPRIAALEDHIKRLYEKADDPAPRPEARVQFEALRRDIEDLQRNHTRLEDRINSLHNFMLNVPGVRPPFNGKRGDLLEFYPQNQP